MAFIGIKNVSSLLLLLKCVSKLTYNCIDHCRYYKIVEADHILFIVNRERAGFQYDLIYDSIFERCRKHVVRKTLLTLPNQAPE